MLEIPHANGGREPAASRSTLQAAKHRPSCPKIRSNRSNRGREIRSERAGAAMPELARARSCRRSACRGTAGSSRSSASPRTACAASRCPTAGDRDRRRCAAADRPPSQKLRRPRRCDIGAEILTQTFSRRAELQHGLEAGIGDAEFRIRQRVMIEHDGDAVIEQLRREHGEIGGVALDLDLPAHRLHIPSSPSIRWQRDQARAGRRD